MIAPFSKDPFEKKTLWVFNWQKKNSPIYSRFCEALGIDNIQSIEDMPLLPIQAFKDTKVISGRTLPDMYFESSGTSGMQRSRHYIVDPGIYRQSVIKGMNHFYNLDDFVIWAYTPGYHSNPYSSLVWMLNTLIERDESGLSKFLEIGKPINQHELKKVKQSGKRLMLFGAAFGLVDLLELGDPEIPGDSIIMETGGMKTFRREISKTQLHQQLADGFGLLRQNIHSEYGMTELLSQAYSLGGEWFECVPWMQVTIRNPENPMEILPKGEEGVIGVIDLANIHSCSFILTGDKGIMHEEGKFKVLGRWNPQNLRGCNFLIDQD